MLPKPHMLLFLYVVLLTASGPLTEASAADAPWPRTQPSDQFQAVLAQVGDDLFISGQPTEQGLRDLHSAGVRTVINLRTDAEMNDRSVVPFDEAALLETLGMRYVHIPAGGPDTPYTPDMVDRFARALTAAAETRTTEGVNSRVLLHCTVAWRASHLYTAYLHQYAGLSLDDAVARGRAINLGQLPLEGFLGNRLRFEAMPAEVPATNR